jgi:hypothetical protein
MLRVLGGVDLVEMEVRDLLVHLWRPLLDLFALGELGGLLVWGDAFALAELRLARLAFGRLRGLLASTWWTRRGWLDLVYCVSRSNRGAHRRDGAVDEGRGGRQ